MLRTQSAAEVDERVDSMLAPSRAEAILIIMRPTVRTPDPELERITRLIVDRVQPLRIVLFGSRARGDATAASDFDVLIEIEAARREEAGALIQELKWEHALAIDAVLLTPAEYAAQRDDVGFLAWQVEREGRLLYARDRPASDAGPARREVRETPRGRPRSVEVWARRAEHDFIAMELALEAAAPIPDVAAFHAHQTAEKYLKAVIVSTVQVPPRTHDLLALLARCPAPLRESEEVRTACGELNGTYGPARYPEEREPTQAEARRAARSAGVVRAAALKFLERDR